MKQPNCGGATSATVPGLSSCHVSNLPLRFTASPAPPVSPGLTNHSKRQAVTCSEPVSQGRVFSVQRAESNL